MDANELELRRLELDEKKAEQEHQARLKELNLKHDGIALDEKKAEQEHQVRLKELDLKHDENRRSRWSNPLVLGIIAAAIAAAGNGYVSWLNAENQLTVERTRYSGQKELERAKPRPSEYLR